MTSAPPGARRQVLVTASLLAVAGAAVLAFAPGSVGLGRGGGDAVGKDRASLQQTWQASSTGHQVLGGTVRPGVPTVQRDRHDSLSLTVTVAPARPGRNLVRVDTTLLDRGGAVHHHTGDDVPLEVGTDEDHLVPVLARPGTDGLWAEVDLPAGSSTLLLSHGPTHRIEVPVEAGTAAAPDGVRQALTSGQGPECVSALTGRLLAGGRTAQQPLTSCPSASLSATDKAAVTHEVDTLLARGVEELAVLADDSPRSTAAVALVRERAAGRAAVVAPTAKPGPRNALLALSGWERTSTYLAADSGLPLRQRALRTDGTWLAPWLLTPKVVDSTSGAILPLDFDTRDAQPLRYRERLTAYLPDQAPTATGYDAWRRAEGLRAGAPLLYVAARTAFMPAMAGHEAHESQIAWFPGGTITPVERKKD